MHILLAIVLLIIAVAYAAVGLGGGSAYLAVFSFVSHDPNVIRPLAWSLNILAAGVGFSNYYRAGHFSLSFSAPLVIGGIGGAALGASLPITTAMYGQLLAVCLFLISLRMIIKKKRSAESDSIHRGPWVVHLLLGFGVGVISGLIGIGGGIILGPIILVFKQARMKTTAAMTSLYVVLSSAGAMAAHLWGGGGGGGGGAIEFKQLLLYGSVCLVGAYLGSRFGSRRASPRLLELVFGSMVLIAAIRLAVVNF